MSQTAYQKDKTTAAQTSANAAATVAAALVAKGSVTKDDAAEVTVDIFKALFDELGPIVDADNENFIKQDGGGSKSSSSRGTKSSSRDRKTGGRSKSSGRKGGGKSSITVDDAMDLELSWGAFEGETLGALLDIDADTADSDFGYGDGERDGRDYLAWLASDNNNNEFVQRRALLVCEAEGIDVG